MILRSPYPDVVAPDVYLPGLLFGGLTPSDSAGTAIIDAVTDRRYCLQADEVKDFVAVRVAPYKKIRHVEFLEQIPKSAAGKILRKDLRRRELSNQQRHIRELT